MKEQKNPGSLEYPKKGTLNRVLFKGPLIWWRMGMGPILSHPMLAGHKMLVLTSWGRKSKLPRHTMLSYTEVADKIYVVSGWGERSDWYRNIMENSGVTVQVGRNTYTAYARRVEDDKECEGVAQSLFQTGGDSHFGSWLEALSIEYDLKDLMEKRDRVYFIGFDKNEMSGPPPLAVDLKWVWGVISLVIVVLWLVIF